MFIDMKNFHPHEHQLDLFRKWKRRPLLPAVLLILLIGLIITFSGSLKLVDHLSGQQDRLLAGIEKPSQAAGPGIGNTDRTSQPAEIKPAFILSEDKVRRGDTFETLAIRNGIGREAMLSMLDAARPVYNLNRVVIGRSLNFTFTDSCLDRFEYEINEDETLLLEAVDSSQGSAWKAGIEETVYRNVERELCGTIESSLYQTVMNMPGGHPEMVLKLSEIYAWQIDFHNDIRKGDTFKLVYEEKRHPKGKIKIGTIKAAFFSNAGKDLWAIRFTNPNGKTDYFDLEGRSMRRAFLRSPFKYMPRISSRFSYRRFHPILKIYRPHLGVDYAAPTGTPVLALGDGRVKFRGWKGGFGKYILVKHNGMYSTTYGHLSRYARNLKAGSYVTQGQVIGYVGSTGLSTGPHLDFRFYKNGKPVNPLKVDVPAGDPVDMTVFDRFEALGEQVVQRFENIGDIYGPPLAGKSPDNRQASPASSGKTGRGMESALSEDSE